MCGFGSLMLGIPLAQRHHATEANMIGSGIATGILPFMNRPFTALWIRLGPRNGLGRIIPDFANPIPSSLVEGSGRAFVNCQQ
jgi:hypothetical protein